MGVTEEPSRQNWYQPPNKSGAGTLFLESDIKGCRCNLPLSCCFHLYPSFCWTQPNDVPGEKQWLTTSRQDTPCARWCLCGSHCSSIQASSCELCQLCPPNLREILGTDVTLFSLTSLREESRSLQISDITACVHLFTWLKQTLRRSEASAADWRGPSLLFHWKYLLSFFFLTQELKKTPPAGTSDNWINIC